MEWKSKWSELEFVAVINISNPLLFNVAVSRHVFAYCELFQLKSPVVGAR